MKAKEINLKQFAVDFIKEMGVCVVRSEVKGFGDYDGVGLTWNNYDWVDHERIVRPASVMDICHIEVIIHRNFKKEFRYMIEIKPYHDSTRYLGVMDTPEQAFAIKDALDDMISDFRGIEYHVIAVSQCEDLEPSQTIGVFKTIFQAEDFRIENRKEYWTLTIEKCCSHCHEPLEHCHCEKSIEIG
jgi:hypothetical protein